MSKDHECAREGNVSTNAAGKDPHVVTGTLAGELDGNRRSTKHTSQRCGIQIETEIWKNG